MANLMLHDDMERNSSPPGRESRDDWRGGGVSGGGAPSGGGGGGGEAAGATAAGVSKRMNGRSPEGKTRSRSRSPLRGTGKKAYSPSREMRYVRDGTNTTSREPHLERARLFVGNIEPNRTHRRDLTKLFSQYGAVLGVSIHKGYAFIQMDRERSANKAINHEDNNIFMGSRIHVEFSQAALKAGAKFERFTHLGTSPRDRGPQMQDSFMLDNQEREREERLKRILQMEREIAMLRTREGDMLDSRRRSSIDYPHDSYDRREAYRRSPQPPPNYQSYPRDREDSYRGGGDDRGRGRGYYGRQSPPRDYSRGSSGDIGSYRDSVSYPSQFSGGSYGRSIPTVGYGESGLGKGGGGPNSSLPPGWPDDHDKSIVNRPPFATAGPWS